MQIINLLISLIAFVVGAFGLVLTVTGIATKWTGGWIAGIVIAILGLCASAVLFPI